MNTLKSNDYDFFNKRLEKIKNENKILSKKESKELNSLKNIKLKQLEALETIFNYLNETTKTLELSQSRLEDIHDDERELLLELERLKNFITNA